MPIIGGSAAASGGALTRIFDSTAGGAVASFDTGAGGIPAGYSALDLIFYGRGDTAAASVQCNLTFNSDNGNNYYYAFVRDTGNTANAGGGAAVAGIIAANIPAATATANHFGASRITVPNYTGVTGFHDGTGQLGFMPALTAGAEMWNIVYTWASAAAITRITLTPVAGNFVAGSRLTIYGLN